MKDKIIGAIYAHVDDAETVMAITENILAIQEEATQAKGGEPTPSTHSEVGEVDTFAINFANWLNTLTPNQKVSVWSKDGSRQGLYTMDNEQLLDKYKRLNKLTPTKPVKITKCDPIWHEHNRRFCGHTYCHQCGTILTKLNGEK